MLTMYNNAATTTKKNNRENEELQSVNHFTRIRYYGVFNISDSHILSDTSHYFFSILVSTKPLMTSPFPDMTSPTLSLYSP